LYYQFVTQLLYFFLIIAAIWFDCNYWPSSWI